MNTRRPTKKEMWFFAIGQLGWSLLSGLISNLLVNYYLPDSVDLLTKSYIKAYIPQGAIWLGLTVIGIITAVGRLFDAITDPLIANLSDNCKAKSGKRIPFLKWSALPLSIVTVLVFCATSPKAGLNVALLTIFLLLYYLLITAYCTPFNALLPVLGHEQEDRMNISTLIAITYILGTGFAFGANILWNALFSATHWDYYLCAKLVIGLEAIIALVCLWIPAFGIKEKDFPVGEAQTENLFKSLGKTFKNKQFRLFVLSDILYFFGITMFNTGFLYYVSNLLHCYSWYMVLFVFMTFVTFAFYVPVNKLTQKIGKKKMVIIGFIAFAVAFLVCAASGLVTFIPNLVYGFIICVFVGIPLAILGVVPQAIVSDIAEQDCIKTGQNHDGMFFAARTFAMKLGQAVAMVVFTSLAVIGNKYDMISLQASFVDVEDVTKGSQLQATFNTSEDGDIVAFTTLDGSVVHDGEKFVIADGTYTTTDAKNNSWTVKFDTKSTSIEITETKADGSTSTNTGTYTLDANGTMSFSFVNRKGLQVGADGLGYRLSLIVALIFSVLAAVALFFYNEKDVMTTINAEHERVAALKKEEPVTE